MLIEKKLLEISCQHGLVVVLCASLLSACSSDSGILGADSGASVPDLNDVKTGKPCLNNSDCELTEECVNNFCEAISGDEKDGGSGGGDTTNEEDANTGEEDSGNATGKELVVTPEAVVFTDAEIGMPTSKSVVVQNISDHDVVLSNVYLSNESSVEFSLNPSSWSELTLESGEETTIEVVYAPIDGTPDYGAVVIENTSIVSPIEVQLSGTVVSGADFGFYEAEGSQNKLWPDETGSDFNVEFDRVEINQKVEKVYLIKNSGTEALKISKCEIDTTLGTDYGQFKVQLLEGPNGKALSLPATIKQGGSAAVRFAYQPTVSGIHTGKAVIETNDNNVNNDGTSGDNVASIILSGRGGIEEAEISISPDNVNFGDINIGQTSCEKITITNASPDTELDVEYQFAEEKTEYFLTSRPEKIASGASEEAEVCFAPTVQGETNNTLKLISNAKNAPTLDIPLAGNGVISVLDIIPPPPISFGEVVLGNKVEKVITIRSAGGGAITISQIAITDPAGQFSVSSISRNLPFVLTGTGSISVVTAFTPKSTGDFVAELKFSYTATAAGEAKALLGGKGIEPSEAMISVEPPGLDFGTVKLGEKNTQKITVKNVGSVEMEISDIYLENVLPDFNILTRLSSVKALSGEDVEIEFSPSQAGARTDAVTIISNAKNSPILKVSVSGVGDDSCKAGDTLSEACGYCGIREKSCQSGRWSDWSACQGEKECSPSTKENAACGECGSGTRERICKDDCTWGQYSTCACGSQQQQQSCGCNGTQTRSCVTSTCTWGDWSACGNCTAGTQSSSCTNKCGKTSTQERTCNINSCEWTDSTCLLTADEKDSEEDNNTLVLSTSFPGYVGSMTRTSTAQQSIPVLGVTLAPAGDVDYYIVNYDDNSSSYRAYRWWVQVTGITIPARALLSFQCSTGETNLDSSSCPSGTSFVTEDGRNWCAKDINPALSFDSVYLTSHMAFCSSSLLLAKGYIIVKIVAKNPGDATCKATESFHITIVSDRVSS